MAINIKYSKIFGHVSEQGRKVVSATGLLKLSFYFTVQNYFHSISTKLLIISLLGKELLTLEIRKITLLRTSEIEERKKTCGPAKSECE